MLTRLKTREATARGANLAPGRTKARDGGRLFGRHVGQTRQLLRKLTVGRLTIDPKVGNKGRYARITGTGTLEPLVRGICPNMLASPRGPDRVCELEIDRRTVAA